VQKNAGEHADQLEQR